MAIPIRKILVLVPTTYYVAYAYFEDDRLLVWGTKTLGDRPIVERIVVSGFRAVKDLLGKFAPTVVLLPQINSKKKGYRKRFLAALHAIVDKPERPAIWCDRDLLQAYGEKVIGQPKPTRQMIAGYLAEKFSALQPSVPPDRGAWKSEYYSGLLFEAVAMGLAWLSKQP
jgi:hypothetical protein